MMGSSGTETVDQGADAARVSNERPQHAVTIAAGLRLAPHEVTRAEFARFVTATGRDMAGCGNWENGGWVVHPEFDWRNPGFEQTDDDPVVCVSWVDASDYIGWLNARTGRTYRLPTEAEWEYAARGGKDPEKRPSFEYAGGEKLDELGWYEDNSHGETKPVGLKLKNELGLYDMSGNVWEWCEDWYEKYRSKPQTDPKGPVEGVNRVFRGGGWSSTAGRCRVAYRFHDRPTNRRNLVGFRLVLQL